MRILLAFCCLLSGIISCSSNSVMVSPEYKGQSFKDCSVAVILDTKAVTIDIEKDVKDDLGDGQPLVVFLRFFLESFRPQLEKYTQIKDVKYIKMPAAAFFKTEELVFKEEMSSPAPIPVQGVFKQKYAGTDFVINILDMHVFVKKGMNHPGSVTREFDQLKLVSKFYIWDIQQEKLVSHGLIDAGNNIVTGMNKNTWKNAVMDYALKLKAGSPF